MNYFGLNKMIYLMENLLKFFLHKTVFKQKFTKFNLKISEAFFLCKRDFKRNTQGEMCLRV